MSPGDSRAVTCLSTYLSLTFVADHAPLGTFLVTEYLFAVPKDYRNPSAGELQLFARSAVKHETGVNAAKTQEQAASNHRPWSRPLTPKLPGVVERELC